MKGIRLWIPVAAGADENGGTVAEPGIDTHAVELDYCAAAVERHSADVLGFGLREEAGWYGLRSRLSGRSLTADEADFATLDPAVWSTDAVRACNACDGRSTTNSIRCGSPDESAPTCNRSWSTRAPPHA